MGILAFIALGMAAYKDDAIAFAIILLAAVIYEKKI